MISGATTAALEIEACVGVGVGLCPVGSAGTLGGAQADVAYLLHVE